MAAIAELDRLLSSDFDAVRIRELSLRESLRAGDAALVLFGAGNIGLLVSEALRSSRIEPVAFADETESKHGSSLGGVPVMAPAAAVEAAGPTCLVAVTVISAALPFLAARERLGQVADVPVVSAFELMRAVHEGPVPVPFFEPLEDLLAREEAIHETAALFEEDPESVRQLLAHVRFRAELDFSALPSPSTPQYFPPEVREQLGEAPFRFVDGGAYDGDTLADLLEIWPNRVEQIDAFEPDGVNFNRLARFVGSLPDRIQPRVELHPCALGSRSQTMGFAGTGDEAASLRAGGSKKVDVVSLDGTVEADGAQLFIKLDIEGGESNALRGATALLGSARPMLAVCLYHRPGDLWEIPLCLASLDIGYRFLLRTHGHDGMDLVLYALPPSTRS